MSNETVHTFDFGFTMANLDEIEAFQEQKQAGDTASAEAEEAESKLIELRAAIQPLLNNLKQEPDRDYILWQNRLPKIEQFEAHLDQIITK